MKISSYGVKQGIMAKEAAANTYTLTDLTTHQILSVGVLLLELDYAIVPLPQSSLASRHEDFIGPTTLVHPDGAMVVLHQPTARTTGSILVEGSHVSEVVRIVRQWLAEKRDPLLLRERAFGEHAGRR